MHVKQNKIKQSTQLNKMIGQFIRESRLAKSLSGAEFGKLINVSQQQVSRYENGVTSLSIEALDNIFSALGINWSDFYQKIFHVHDDDFIVNSKKG